MKYHPWAAFEHFSCCSVVGTIGVHNQHLYFLILIKNKKLILATKCFNGEAFNTFVKLSILFVFLSVYIALLI